MKLFLWILLLGALAGCGKPDAGRPAGTGSAESALPLAAQAPAAKRGAALPEFLGAWAVREEAPDKRADIQSPAAAERQMRDRIARFRAAHPDTQAGTATAPAPATPRSGDLSGLRAGDQAVLGTGAAMPRTPTPVDAGMEALRREQMAERIERFRIAQQLRQAQSGMTTNTPPGFPPVPAGVRPGDKPGPRPGDLALLRASGP